MNYENIVLCSYQLLYVRILLFKVVMAKDDCDAIMFDTFLEPLYQGKLITFLLKSNLICLYKYTITYK